MMLATEADLLQLSPPSSLGGGLCGAMGQASNMFNSGMGNTSSSVLIGSGITNGSIGPTYRAKPGHCNGTVNSTGSNPSAADRLHIHNGRTGSRRGAGPTHPGGVSRK